MQKPKPSKIASIKSNPCLLSTIDSPIHIKENPRKNSKHSFNIPDSYYEKTKSPTYFLKLKSAAKSISNINSIKIPMKKNIAKPTKKLPPAPIKFLSESPKEKLNNSNVNPALLAKGNKSLSPQSDFSLNSINYQIPQLVNTQQAKRTFRLGEIFDFNDSNHNKEKGTSCLENIIMVEELRKIETIDNLATMKVCSEIIKDFQGRMQKIGKKNEGVLVEKIWQVAMGILLSTMSTKNKEKNEESSPEMLPEITIEKLKKDTNRVKKQLKKIQNNIQDLEMITRSSENLINGIREFIKDEKN